MDSETKKAIAFVGSWFLGIGLVSALLAKGTCEPAGIDEYISATRVHDGMTYRWNVTGRSDTKIMKAAVEASEAFYNEPSNDNWNALVKIIKTTGDGSYNIAARVRHGNEYHHGYF